MDKTRFAAPSSRQSMPRSNWIVQAPTAVLALVLALALAWVLSGCGGGGASDSVGAATAPAVNVNQDPPATSVVNVNQETPESSVVEPIEKRALQPSQPGELLAYVKNKLEQRQQLRADRRSNYVNFSTAGDPSVAVAVFSASLAPPAPERSSTVIQEDGVDEADIIKSNGSIIATLDKTQGASLVDVRRVLPTGAVEVAAQLPLNSDPELTASYTGMYLTNKPARLSVLGWSSRSIPLDVCAPAPRCVSASLLGSAPLRFRPTVLLDLVNVANPNSPSVSDKLRIEGSLVGSRLIGNSLVLVTQFTPALVADSLPWNAPTAEREAAMSRITAAELLPTISINNGPTSPLVQETDCFIEPKNANYGLEVTSITVLDLSSATLQRSTRCFVGGSDTLYMSTSALYLATTSYAVQPAGSSNRLVYPTQISTDIHKFAFIKGPNDPVATVDFRGSGSVIGHLGWSTQQRSYRLSEYNGDLRVLTFTGQSGWGVLSDASSATAPAPSPATLTVLREATTGKSLKAVGQIPNKTRPQPIGKPGEQVYAVRFMGDRGYVVTFRRVDPLYILDLSKPTDPQTTGELTIAGFSDYLFPVGPSGSGLLLGVGKDADDRGAITGVKVALFDVADPAKPTQRSTVTFRGTSSHSGLDASRHGIDLFTRGNQTRVALPVVSMEYITTTAGAQYSYTSALQRFEVDANARSMKLLAPLAQTPGYRWVLEDRSLQIGNMLHHFVPGNGRELAGSFSSYTW
ncbi:MAG: hypothetical protein HEQ39_04205 [Rhizobacter sp.]